MLELVGADYLHPEDNFLTAERVKEIHRAGFGINAWTVDDLGRANQLANWGVDGIISNVANTLMGITGAKSEK